MWCAGMRLGETGHIQSSLEEVKSKLGCDRIVASRKVSHKQQGSAVASLDTGGWDSQRRKVTDEG